jgi:HAD superfamily hydrolase (TIGR01490 family)
MPIAAIFDLDDTLLDGSSGRMFLEYMRQEGLAERYIRRRDMARFGGEYLLHKLGLVDATRLLNHMARLLKGLDMDEMWRLARSWYTDMLAPTISQLALERLAWHRSQGHTLLICSGSSQFAVLQVAAQLNISHTIYTEWQGADGVLKGTLRQPLVYGAGKVYWAERWAKENGIDLAESYFYSDHISDLPLMEIVAHPVAINPDKRLARLATRRGWPVYHWRNMEHRNGTLR